MRGHQMTLTKRLVALLGASALVAASFTAEAATLDAIQGGVLVNRGAGYEVATGPTELKPGDLVIANPDGSAQVSYTDGCSVPVQAGTVVGVEAQSPCATQANNRPAPGPEAPASAGLNTSTLVIGGLVVAGGVGAALALGGGGSDKPASP